MAQSKKSRLLTTGLAVTLAAAVLVGGGTFSYLQDETDDVVNEFNANQVTVDLDETTGNDYEIIPGTEEAKDPKVTVNATVDSYVFVKVNDATYGLVDYTIADGWTLLKGYDNVYYREVTADAEIKEFPVLADNKVSYDAALENADMVDEDGNLKDGLDLTFTAYAIQQAGFESAEDAYNQEITCCITDGEKLQQAIYDCDEGGTVKLCMDIETDYIYINKTMTLDLNGYTLDLNAYLDLGNSYDDNLDATNTPNITIKNGTITGGDYDAPICVYSYGDTLTVTLEDVTVTPDAGVRDAIYSNGSDGQKVTLTLKNCTTTGPVEATDTHLVINSGTYKTRAEDNRCIYSNFGGVINGGTFTAGEGQMLFEVYPVYNDDPIYDFVINDGIFNYKEKYAIYSPDNSPSTFVEITGGTFNSVDYGSEGATFDDVTVKDEIE